MSEDFKKLIREFDEIDTTLKMHREQSKLLNQRKKQLETTIVTFMKSNNVSEATTKKHRVIHKQSKRTQAPKKSEFKTIVVEFFSKINWATFPTLPPFDKAVMLEQFMKSKNRMVYSDSVSLKQVNAKK